MSNLLQIEGVWKVYHLGKIDVEVLRGVDLNIKKGEFITVLGPSGSGKSTLLNMMSCLDTPTKGRVVFEGEDVSHMSEDELATVRGKNIGFIFQQFNLLMHLTALENVTIPTVFQGTSRAEREKKATSLLDSVDLLERVDHRPGELSGGEKQRVAIARALVNSPDVIVADEPTGNVDSKTGEKIMNILKDLNKEGKTVIVVTHDEDLVPYADRAIRIKDGQIV